MNLNLGEMGREEKLRAMHALWEYLVQGDEAIEFPGLHSEELKESESVQAGSRAHLRLGQGQGGTKKTCAMIVVILDSALEALDCGRRFYECLLNVANVK